MQSFPVLRALGWIALLQGVRCLAASEPASPASPVSDPESLPGKKAAAIHCVICHALPNPSDLDRRT